MVNSQERPTQRPTTSFWFFWTKFNPLNRSINFNFLDLPRFNLLFDLKIGLTNLAFSGLGTRLDNKLALSLTYNILYVKICQQGIEHFSFAC